MTTTEVYEQILAELEAGGEMDELQRQILAILRRVYPASVSRGDFIREIFGVEPPDLTRSILDRKIRKAIEAMRDLLIPIVSSSGEAGYRLDVSEEAIDAMIREWASRESKFHDRRERAEMLKIRIRQSGVSAIPSEIPVSEHVEQLALFQEA